MKLGHLVGVVTLTVAALLTGGLAFRSPVSSQGSATPSVPDTASSASIEFESYDGTDRISFTVYRAADATTAHILYESLSSGVGDGNAAV